MRAPLGQDHGPRSVGEPRPRSACRQLRRTRGTGPPLTERTAWPHRWPQRASRTTLTATCMAVRRMTSRSRTHTARRSRLTSSPRSTSFGRWSGTCGHLSSGAPLKHTIGGCAGAGSGAQQASSAPYARGQNPSEVLAAARARLRRSAAGPPVPEPARVNPWSAFVPPMCRVAQVPRCPGLECGGRGRAVPPSDGLAHGEPRGLHPRLVRGPGPRAGPPRPHAPL